MKTNNHPPENAVAPTSRCGNPFTFEINKMRIQQDQTSGTSAWENVINVRIMFGTLVGNIFNKHNSYCSIQQSLATCWISRPHYRLPKGSWRTKGGSNCKLVKLKRIRCALGAIVLTDPTCVAVRGEGISKHGRLIVRMLGSTFLSQISPSLSEKRTSSTLGSADLWIIQPHLGQSLSLRESLTHF